MKVLVTGTAGFIGFHLANRMLQEGYDVVGLDNINDYYDTDLKYARLKEAGIQRDQIAYNTYVPSLIFPSYRFIQLNLEDRDNMHKLFRQEKFDRVCNLAAQAGVRYSLTHPYAYIDSNIVGFINILEACRHNSVKHLVYASSSSVYGLNESIPFSEKDNVDHPISLYAATKKSNELMAHTYSYLYGLPTSGLRFFTVYGPWGRIYNIGNSKPVKLMDFVLAIEEATGKKAIIEMMPMQAGDVKKTWAEVKKLNNDFMYSSKTNIGLGINNFIKWFNDYNIK
jgi:UDP-glucuronate 4-epimerase